MAYQTFRAAAAVELEDELSESAQLAELALLTPDSDSADLQRQHEPVSAGSGATTAQRTHASATHKSSKQTNKLATVHASKEKKNKAQPSATQPESARAAKQSRLTPSHKSAACSRVPQSPPATPRAQSSAAAGAAAEPEAAVAGAAMPSSSSGAQSPRGRLAPPRAHATADEQEKHKGKSQAKKKKKSKSNNNSTTNNMAARESAPVDAASGSEADDPFAGTQSQDAGDQMSEVSEDDFDDDAMRGAWGDIFKAAEQRGGDYNFSVIEDAVREWNKDKVALRWSDKAMADTASSPRYKALLLQRYDDFIEAVVVYLNRSWTFIQHLAVPIIIQRVTKRGSDGKDYVDIVKQGEAGFTCSLQHHSMMIRTPVPETGNLYLSPRPVAKLWLKSKHRQSKSKIMFVPKLVGELADYNMWTGWAITREAAVRAVASKPPHVWQEQAKVFSDHILHIWCQGDANLCGYVLDWLAHVVQRPEIKVSVALLIRGEQGAGKGVVQEILRKILGRTHSSYFVNLSQMLGQYNGEFLEKCVLGIVDEVTLDKGFDYSKIKALITEDTHTIELKYVAPYVVDNYTAFMFFSNHEHVMRLEPGDRRFVVLEAASTYAGPETAASAAYFDNVRGVWLEAVSHMLNTRDLSNFRPRAAPVTLATMQQKLMSLDTVSNWWMHCLRTGEVPAYNSFPNHPSNRAAPGPWQLLRRKETVFEKYREWSASESPSAKPAEMNMFWQKMKRISLSRDARLVDSETKKKVLVVQFQPRDECIDHFASTVLRGSADMFRGWLQECDDGSGAGGSEAAEVRPSRSINDVLMPAASESGTQ